MSPLLIEILLFIVGLACLVKGGDWFVDGATGIAHRFNMPEVLIGATVVSIGTTIPEVMVSSTAALTDGASDMAYGNAIGSIICNTALIAAVTMTFRPAPVEKESLKKPIIFFFCAAAFYVAVSYISGYFSRPVGIILLAVFIAYMITAVKDAKAHGSVKAAAPGGESSAGGTETARSMSGTSLPAAEAFAPVQTPVAPEESRMTDEYIENVINRYGEDGENVKSFVFDENSSGGDSKASGSSPACQSSGADQGKKDLIRFIAFLILGAALIAVGADLLVDNGTLIAEAFGVPQSVIALTFVALGTSLPELVTAITSLVKGHSDLSLGNVIGANLFNLVLVSGLAITLKPFHIPVEKTIAGVNASLVVDIPVMIAVMLIMCLPALIKGRIYRAQGLCLLGIYVAYVAFQLF
ncbi:MAG: calcium/sodium antiporter [Lachnospiraceae bacterium]|nr:calcium/sodium antiporter [Lachnospiraceae bacterium]